MTKKNLDLNNNNNISIVHITDSANVTLVEKLGSVELAAGSYTGCISNSTIITTLSENDLTGADSKIVSLYREEA